MRVRRHVSSSHRRIFQSVAALGLFATAGATALAQSGYTIKGLGGLGTSGSYGNVTSFAQSVNIKGQIVGNSTLFNGLHQSKGNAAFLFQNGSMINLGSLGSIPANANNPAGYQTAVATGINDAAQIVGYSYVYDSGGTARGQAAFLYQNGTLINLEKQWNSGAVNFASSATGINTAGAIVGYTYTGNNRVTNRMGFLYRNNTLTPIVSSLGTDSAGRNYCFANAINDLGQVVGEADAYDSSHKHLGAMAFVWQNQIMTSLGNLGVDPNGLGDSHAQGISSNGQIVGYSILYLSNLKPYGYRAFRFQAGQMTPLQVLATDDSGYSNAMAYAVNDQGTAVGYSNRYVNNIFTEQDAVMWQGTFPTDLNTFLPPNSGWHLDTANSINNRGQIVGVGTHNGSTEAFVLTPFQSGDFNRDGSPDLIFQNSQSGDVILVGMNGLTRLLNTTIAQGIAPDWKIVATPDLNNDGYADLVWQNTTTGDIVYWLLEKGIYADYGVIASGVPTNYQIVGSGDFNGDGFADLVLQNKATGDVYLWYMAYGTLYDSSYVGKVPVGNTTMSVAGIGDINGDGKPDILWRDPTNGDLWVWYMNNAAAIGSAKIWTGVPLNYQIAGIGDYNSDGKTDLLWQDTLTGNINAWLMNGSTVLSFAPVVTAGSPIYKAVGPR